MPVSISFRSAIVSMLILSSPETSLAKDGNQTAAGSLSSTLQSACDSPAETHTPKPHQYMYISQKTLKVHGSF